jgi:tetratricopeptide (TPR) repeat protein
MYELPNYAMDAERQDWRAALADAEAADRSLTHPDDSVLHVARFGQKTWVWPWLAFAKAKLGDLAGAHALIDRTPGDCYLCVRTRGKIDAVQKNWGGATYWYGDAVKQAPSIPFAYTDWGAMLLAKGDIDGAIAKFTLANQKGPHFADPLEMWGEALILKNRSDLALAKFAEADKYAPHWGRLHLKWGEALLWLGRKDEAQKQFALAARLDLSAAERASVERWLKAG